MREMRESSTLYLPLSLHSTFTSALSGADTIEASQNWHKRNSCLQVSPNVHGIDSRSDRNP
jgi:hypothetical protein